MKEHVTSHGAEADAEIREDRRRYEPPSLLRFGALGQIIRGATGTAPDLASQTSTCPEDTPNVCT